MLSALILPVSGAHKHTSSADRLKEEKTLATGPAVMWRDPTNIESRNLFYGPGGKEHEPTGAFTFVEEDLDGSSPKFVVRDQNGEKWKVKLGQEARPETVSSRLVWAVGYHADEDYFVRDLKVQGLPARLHRGQQFVEADGSVHNARLKRQNKGEERKVGNWYWRHDAFTGTRELNGLKVLMAVINNWDLKDENNAVYQAGPERIYMISDLGASFGAAGRTWPREKAKDNLASYRQSLFIRRTTADTVDFAVPARPRWVYWVDPPEVIRRIHLEWIGKNVPRQDAKWMGQLLARLSPQQVRDAFRAGGYSPDESEQFAKLLEQRISVLTDL
jgi:hypothetical protein